MKIAYWVIATVTLAASFSGAAFAGKITQEAYHAAMSQADMEFKTAKEKCDSLAGNPKNICFAEAKGALSVAKANAEAEYQGTEPARLKAAKSKVEAEYRVANELCNDLSGNKKDVCRQEAKAAKVKGDKAAQLASKKVEATSEFMNTENKARQEAGQANRDAEYKIVVEKCNQYSGDAREQCIMEAKTEFGK
jgi:hypothetical protein